MKPSTASVSGASDITTSGSVNCRLIRPLNERQTRRSGQHPLPARLHLRADRGGGHGERNRRPARPRRRAFRGVVHPGSRAAGPGRRPRNLSRGLPIPARPAELLHRPILKGMERQIRPVPRAGRSTVIWGLYRRRLATKDDHPIRQDQGPEMRGLIDCTPELEVLGMTPVAREGQAGVMQSSIERGGASTS